MCARLAPGSARHPICRPCRSGIAVYGDSIRRERSGARVRIELQSATLVKLESQSPRLASAVVAPVVWFSWVRIWVYKRQHRLSIRKRSNCAAVGRDEHVLGAIVE